MQKWQFTIISSGILIIAIIISGCVGSQTETPKPIFTGTIMPPQTTMITPSPTTIATVIQTKLPTPTSTVTIQPPAIPPPSPSQETVSVGPLNAPVHLGSNQIPKERISFTTVHPGKVNIRVYCLWPGTATLTSATMADQVLVKPPNNPGSVKGTILNLITPQTYWITFSGLNKIDAGNQKMWAVDITNA